MFSREHPEPRIETMDKMEYWSIGVMSQINFNLTRIDDFFSYLYSSISLSTN